MIIAETLLVLTPPWWVDSRSAVFFFFPGASITVQLEHYEVIRFGRLSIGPVTELQDYIKGLPFSFGG